MARAQAPAIDERRMRRLMRDLVALSTLPAVWVGLGRDGIARSLGDALTGTLSLDLVYVRLADREAGRDVEVLRSPHRLDGAGEAAVRASLGPLLQAERGERPVDIPNPFGAGTLRTAIARFGLGEDHGLLVAASHRRDFPTEQDRLLLGVGANQTGLALQRRQAEARLREQREWLEVTLASIADAVITVDTGGRVILLNRVAAELTGWDLAAARGKPLQAVLELRDAAGRGMESPFLDALRDGRTVDPKRDAVLVAKGGEERAVDLSASPIRDAAGRQIGAVVTFRDVTKQRDAEQARRRGEEALRRSEEHLRAIVETTPACIKVVAPDGALLDMNAAGLAMVDARGPEELLGRCVYELVGAEHRAAFREFNERICRGEKGSLAFETVGLRGTRRRMETFAAPLRSPDGSLVQIAVTVDVTERERAQAALADARARLDAALEAGAIVTWTWDIPANRLFADSNLARLFNLPPSEAEGGALESYTRSIHPDDLPGVMAALARAVERDEVYEADYRILQGDGSVRWVAARGRAERDAAGRPLRMPGVLVDITERKRLEEELRLRVRQLAEADRRKEELVASLRESEEKLRLLADTIPQLAWMARPDGHIFWYNRRWYEYTGTTPAGMEGWGWQSVHDPQVLPAVLERWKGSIESGEPFDMVFPLRGADGQFRPFLTRVNPLRSGDGRILYWFGTNTDISEIKRMEEALREADRRKDEFLATLAHELRNPLAPIRSSLEILKIPRLDAATARQAHEMMERQVQSLVRLVDDLLDVARVMRGKIELRKEPVELASVVARAVETVQPLIDGQGHRLRLAMPQEPLLVHADALRLTQVVGNLLANAAKYTEAGGNISLVAERRGAEVLLRVRDNGIGIAPDMLPHIFDLFVQADHAFTRAQGGLGIGLTLVRNLAEMHGGAIAAHSEGLGKGSEFVLRLPLLAQRRASLPEAPGEASAPVVAPPPGHRLLVVDDNRDAALSLATLLRLQGHDVRVAHDGPSALALASQAPPDLVFLDIGMPEMDGYEVARRMRRDPGMRGVRLVALTGWGQEEDRRRTAAAGFDHHVVKPLEARVVTTILGGLAGAGSPADPA